MGDTAEHEHEDSHGGHIHNPLAGLSTKQKVIGGAVLGVVALGIMSARNKSIASQAAAKNPSFDYSGVLYPPSDWITPGSSGGTPPLPGSGSTTPPTTTPGGSVGGTPTPTPVIVIPSGGHGSGEPAPYVPPVVAAFVPAPVIAPVVTPGYGVGFGGTSSKPVIVANEKHISADQSYLLTEESRTQTVIDNRVKAGMDTTAQHVYQDHLEAVAAQKVLAGNGATVTVESGAKVIITGVRAATTASGEHTAVSNVSTNNSPGFGVGGGNYGQATAAEKKSMENSTAQIKAGNQGFIQSEQQRAAQVVSDRKAAGLDITDQTRYQQKLVAAAPAPTPAPPQNQNYTNWINFGGAPTPAPVYHAPAPAPAPVYHAPAPAPAPAPSYSNYLDKMHADYLAGIKASGSYIR